MTCLNRFLLPLITCIFAVGCSGDGTETTKDEQQAETPSDLAGFFRQEVPSRPEKLEWGQVVNGLQMAAWHPPGRTEVYCVIMNVSDRTVKYCSYTGNFWEKVFARAEDTSSWKKLQIGFPGRMGYLRPAGATPICDVRELAPNAEILRKDFITGRDLNYTFSVDLRQYAWPTSFKGKLIAQIKIKASLRDISGGQNVWKGKLQSQVIKIPVKDLEETGCLLTGISGEELIKEYVVAGLALKNTNGVPCDEDTAFMARLATPKELEKVMSMKPIHSRFGNARREIYERGKEIVPLLMDFLRKEVPENRPEDEQGISPSFTRDVIDLLVRINDPKPVQLLVEILEGYNGTATKAERRVALDGLEKLTVCSFKKQKPYMDNYDKAVEHPEALDYAAFTYDKAAKLYRKWLAGEGKTPRQWYSLKRAREILESDDIEGIYCAASFLAGYFIVYPEMYVRRDDQNMKTLKRLSEVVGDFEKRPEGYFWKGKKIPASIGNWIGLFAAYDFQAQPYAKLLIRLHKENPDGYLWLGQVGGREIMEFLFDSLGKLKSQNLLDCRIAIDRQIGRTMKSDKERREWWEANKRKYGK